MSTGDDDYCGATTDVRLERDWVERMVTEDKLKYLRHEDASHLKLPLLTHGITCPCKGCSLDRALKTLERTHPHMFKKGSRTRATTRK